MGVFVYYKYNNLLTDKKLSDSKVEHLENELKDRKHQVDVIVQNMRREIITGVQAEFDAKIPGIRAEAIKSAKRVSRGFDVENVSPLLQQQFSSRDFRHIGDPVDFIIFAGADRVRDGQQNLISEVIIMDIKTGTSDLNTVQRRIRDAIVAGRVRFAVFNTDSNTIRFWPENKEIPVGEES